MKNLFVICIFLSIHTCKVFAQQTWRIRAIVNAYNTEAPPQQTSGVEYQIVDNNGSPITAAQGNNCSVNWVSTYGIINPNTGYSFQNNQDGTTKPFGSNGAMISMNWENAKLWNSNGTMIARGKLQANFFTTNQGPNQPACPLNNRSIQPLEVNIKYLGTITSYVVNGSTINSPSSITLPCGTQTVTVSVPPTEGASNYQLLLTPLNVWTGTTALGASGGGANTTFTLQSDAGSNSVMIVSAGRSDVSNFRTYSPQVNFTRPVPGSGVSQIQGSPSLCVNSTNTYTLNGVTSGVSVSWVASGGIAINGSNTGSSVNVTATGNQISTLTANIVECGGNAPPRNFLIQAGTPDLQAMKFGTSGSSSNLVNTVNLVSANTWYVIRTEQLPNTLTGNISWSPSISINSYPNGSNNQDYYFNLSSGQSVTIGVNASNICGSSNRNPVFTTYSGFRVASNPVKDNLTLIFDHTDYWEALPDAIELVSEKQMKTVRTLNVQDVFSRKAFKNGKNIEFDIRDLPRGVYYLRVINPRQEKDKQAETIRLVFE